MQDFFLNGTAPTDDYTLSLHDALPIFSRSSAATRKPLPRSLNSLMAASRFFAIGDKLVSGGIIRRSEEHTSELQSQSNLVCRLLLEKKKQSIVYQRQMQP